MPPEILYSKMNSSQLVQWMIKDQPCVLAIDQLLSIINFDSIFIVNSDELRGPGEHWFAMFFPRNGLIEFWDPLVMRRVLYFLCLS